MGYFDRTCQSSESTWKTVSAVNTSVMPLDFYVTPKNNNMDGVIGLSNGNASGYADVAVSVRFNADGFIDIRDGDVYRADTPIAYHACDKFRIQLNVDMQNHTFSAAVDTGDMLASLASVAKFRTQQQNVSQLDRLVHFSETGTQEVCYEAK